MNNMNLSADQVPSEKSFVVFFGKHDYSLVNISRVNKSFEDGLRRYKPKKNAALNAAVKEAVSHMKSRVAMPDQTDAQIWC